jgi:hypothetical protein
LLVILLIFSEGVHIDKLLPSGDSFEDRTNIESVGMQGGIDVFDDPAFGGPSFDG